MSHYSYKNKTYIKINHSDINYYSQQKKKKMGLLHITADVLKDEHPNPFAPLQRKMIKIVKITNNLQSLVI